MGSDIGPFKFGASSSVGDLKERLWAEWPTDGALARDRPAAVPEIRLICGGKFLDNATTLTGLARVIGPPDPEVPVTMHVIVRPPAPTKAAEAKAKPQAAKSCCTIS